MKTILIILLILSIGLASEAQPKKKGKVKRKYQKTERVTENQPDVFIRGKVQNQDDELLVGALVKIIGTKKAVHTNEDGEYYFSGLPLDRLTIQVSFMGYRTKSIDYTVHSGNNYINFSIDEERVKIDPLISTAEKREEQILDIPASVSIINNEEMENLDIREPNDLSDYVPGLSITKLSSIHPEFTIRGITNDDININASPRISVYYDEIPINQISGAAPELFDMDRVEVLKGPQGSLFSKGAMIGAVHYVSKKPVTNFSGYLSGGLGNYNQQTVNGAINIPLLKKKLFTRIAGVYDYNDGYVKNLLGGNLNGKNNIAGRFSIRFLPSIFTKIDIEADYQKNNDPGTAYMSKIFPNTNGLNDLFGYETSLDKGFGLSTQKEGYGAILKIRQYKNEHTYISSITSYRRNQAFEEMDGDGSAARSIDITDSINTNQFIQELRLNYSLGNKMNGSLGTSYWREKANQAHSFSTNEQNMAYLFTSDPVEMILSDGQPNLMTNLPNDSIFGSLAGTSLPSYHNEVNNLEALNQSLDVYADATYNFTRKISVTGGIRYSLNRSRLSYQAAGDSTSVLGMLTDNTPNILFKLSDKQELKKTFSILTGRINASYKYNEDMTFYMGYSKGQRPQKLQFNTDSTSEVVPSEKVNSYELGYKGIFLSRFWVDLNLFYQEYSNFRTNVWVTDSISNTSTYQTVSIDKATAYGGEATLRFAILKQLEFFSNYSYIHSRFNKPDSLISQGASNTQNHFRLTPEHSFSVGLNASVYILPTILLFATPTFSYKSHFYFEDANTEGIEQDAYGILSIRGGFKLVDPDITLSVYANNLLAEKYLISGGNIGSRYGIPTFIPGSPRLIGTKLTWRF